MVMRLAAAALLFAGMAMAGECRLAAPVSLTVTQDGIVGPTGTVWTIGADCNFSVARIVGFKTLAPNRTGQLAPEQAARLEALLDRVRQSAPPRHFGAAPQANPRRIALTFGAVESELILPPGAADNADERARPMLDLAAAIREMLGS
jgi:hypothetical protein